MMERLARRKHDLEEIFNIDSSLHSILELFIQGPNFSMMITNDELLVAQSFFLVSCMALSKVTGLSLAILVGLFQYSPF